MTQIIEQVQNQPAFQRRVLIEFLDLQEKSRALRAFLSSKAIDDLSPVDQNLLFEQYRIMGMYLGILESRLDRFTK